MTAPILGIDFGTTNTAASFFDRAGKLRLVPVKEKVFTLPSVVWYRAADKAVVGHAARMQIIDDAKHTLYGVKRFLGRRYQSEFVTQNKDRFAFPLIEGADGYCATEIYGQILTLVDVVHQVIRQIVDHANHVAGEPFTECVVTVPAHATIRQREATRKAAEKAGLKVRAMINEPTAAALYYANLRNPEQLVLIFDLGGGTFDATLMAVKNRTVQVLATGGDAFLGGSNFDQAIIQTLVDDFQRKHGLDLRENTVVMQRLVFAAESAKIALSRQPSAQIRVPVVAQKDGKFLDFEYTLDREMLERMVSPLIERSAGRLRRPARPARLQDRARRRARPRRRPDPDARDPEALRALQAVLERDRGPSGSRGRDRRRGARQEPRPRNERARRRRPDADQRDAPGRAHPRGDPREHGGAVQQAARDRRAPRVERADPARGARVARPHQRRPRGARPGERARRSGGRTSSRATPSSSSRWGRTSSSPRG